MAPAGTNPKIEELRFKVKTDPKSRLFYPLAEELRKIGQAAEAEQVLRTGLEHHPTYLSAWVVLGRVLREQQKHADAVPALSKALDLDRGNVVAARLLADSYYALGEKVESIKKYKLVHALMPGDDEIEAIIHRIETELAGASDKDPFDITYSGLNRKQEIAIETGDDEPMAAAHEESPFDEPAVGEGYTADAFSIEEPPGVHLTEGEEPAPEGEIAPGFIQGSFDANVPPPPPQADDFARTLTMADLYANQGLVDEARDIYEDVLARDPGNEAVRAKLEALEASGLGPQASEPEPEDEEPTMPIPEARGPRPEAPSQPSPEAPKVKKLETWLSKVKRSGVGSV
ncbi:MAG TPA: tetratricopeptide repeat protein [Thermoanaerobaculia bacterium]|nr:tetratricopeptide repeat protein [Thermoanaerobaculia bacterium]